MSVLRDYDAMAGTSEIADKVGCTHRTAYLRLQSLESEGKIKGTKVGNSLVWTVSE